MERVPNLKCSKRKELSEKIKMSLRYMNKWMQNLKFWLEKMIPNQEKLILISLQA